ncbi:MAG TPA: hypothetical protein VF485_02840 [Sphingomonas sp.]
MTGKERAVLPGRDRRSRVGAPAPTAAGSLMLGSLAMLIARGVLIVRAS